MEVKEYIESAHKEHRRLFALLIDPEKDSWRGLELGGDCCPDLILVGGSTGEGSDALIRALRRKVSVPVVLFPGSLSQLSAEADAVLFLSLLSGRNPEWLVGEQVRASKQVKQLGLESLSMGYILVDGGKETATMRVTETAPIPASDADTIVSTALAAELMGKELVYLEAGSGAEKPVPAEVIRAVREAISVPLIVGGGIRSRREMDAAYNAGADIVVIGNHLETHPGELGEFVTGKAKEQEKTSPSASADDERYMRLALSEARKAYEAGEVPVGCVIVCQNQVVGRGHNLTEMLQDVTAHAEIQAITAAAQTLGAKYLNECTLYVTVEPCIMCAGAIGWAQVSKVVYGCEDIKRGFKKHTIRALHPKCKVTSGVLEPECRQLMQQFFQSKRI